jgi:hypothetical protein
MKKLTYNPFFKPATAYRNALFAFRDAEYANWSEKPEPHGISPFWVTVVFLAVICATILLSNFLE